MQLLSCISFLGNRCEMALLDTWHIGYVCDVLACMRDDTGVRHSNVIRRLACTIERCLFYMCLLLQSVVPESARSHSPSLCRER